MVTLGLLYESKSCAKLPHLLISESLTRTSWPPARRFEPTARREITNYKHHLIIKLGKQIPNYNIQISNKIKSQLFGILNFSHCDLPFDYAQGGELVEPFGICDLLFEIF
jgi:hypothetical protein